MICQHTLYFYRQLVTKLIDQTSTLLGLFLLVLDIATVDFEIEASSQLGWIFARGSLAV